MVIMLKLKFVVFVVTIIASYQACQCQLDGPDPKEAVLRGETHVLTCRKSSQMPNLLTWIDGENIQLFLGKTKVSFEEKYENFEVISNNDEQLDLQINTAAVSDEGEYMCQLAGTSALESTTLTVEVQAASMLMTQDGADVETVTVTAGVPSDIVCTASGARPAVKVEWYHQIDGQGYTNITSSASDVVSDNGDDTFDTVSTLSYDTIQEYNDGGLRCITTGQMVAGSLDDTATLTVQYPPTVNLQYGSDTVTCSSDANPAVVEPNGYKIIINDADVYTPTCTDGECTLELKVDYAQDVRCNATNSVGTGTKTIVAVPGAVRPSPTIKTPVDADLKVNINAICTPVPPSDDVTVVIKIDGTEIDEDTDVTLPDTGCIDIECILMKGPKTTSRNSRVCKDLQPACGVSLAAVAVPLALIAAGAIVFAIIVLLRSRSHQKNQTDDHMNITNDLPCRTDKNASSTTYPQQSTIVGSSAVQPYMELDKRTREKQGLYQDPQSATYEDIGEGSKPVDDSYQELGQPGGDTSVSKEYVNVPQLNRGTEGKR